MSMNLKIQLATVTLLLWSAVGCNTAQADVVAVVSAKNPVARLSKAQVIDIFLGKNTRFPDGSQAVPVDQEEGSSARAEFYASYGGRTTAQLKAYWSKIIFTGRGQPPKTAASDAEVRKLLAANTHVIAYVERSAVDDGMKVLGGP